MAAHPLASRLLAGLAGGTRIWLAGLLLSVAASGAHATVAESMAAGARAHQDGGFEEALVFWDRAQLQAQGSGDAPAQARALLGAARSYLALGRAPLATQRLEQARALAAAQADPALIGSISAALGSALLLAGEPAKARPVLEQAITLARADRDQDVIAQSANDLARLEAEAGNTGRAAEWYRHSMVNARLSGNPALEATAAVNLARLPLTPDARAQALAQAGPLVRALPHSHIRAMTLVSIARLRSEPADPAIATDADRRQAAADFDDAAATARQIGDARVLSYALGYKGAMEEAANRPQAALALTREAARAARQSNAMESLYRWEWQAGRLLRQLGDDDGALVAYRVAAGTLERIRPDLAASGNSGFRTKASPVYLGVADLLIRRAQRAARPDAAQADLLEARRTMEALKSAELEDFFQDDCVASLKSKTSGIDALAPQTAALYPIVLPDRLSILVSLPDGLREYSVPVPAQAVEAQTRAMRRTLEKRVSREYLAHARQLYDWVVRPVLADLERAGIQTLVFVPDGALRTIPLSALHDGRQFLIERFAVATSPGLTLTDPRPIAGVAPRVLMAGLTEPVQGFAALPGVRSEIERIAALVPGTELLDQAFLASRFRGDLAAAPYTIVHVASHGEFGASAQDTFVLTHDSRINLNELEGMLGGTNYRGQPVQLLVLSACETAAGDDRSALGLAGIAVKAGARSALATLWSVSDFASMQLVGDFYKGLGQPGESKAQALRQAQLALLSDRRYRHPYYWSPFLLIGNWL
ncbi:MAG: CHAT domain-containing protein [Rhodoferax sp.]|nr:CHAT domain-containing protein [Rhodoferax sp.]